ncbi:hypothetical protein [Nesterenkonia lutea]|uniref:Uncharacterized protein n=1 Tax=Nesterenkonia lutea TaxID=272919 RepID=A0ABR9JBH0_9MICC|nr:hypothetical protein [Nesterenkonia lutea]MBE1523282.1 hypothetical protein [Nesterenkonia lutea]
MSTPPYGEQPGGHPGGQPGGQPNPKYGTDPYAPGTYGGPMAEPKKFSLLKTFTLVSLAIYVLNALPGLFGGGDEARQEMISAYEQAGMTGQEAVDAAELGAAFNTGFAWITLIIGVGLYLLVYFGLVKNKNWARVTGIVFAIIGVVLSVVSVAFGALFGLGADMLVVVLTIVYVIVTIYWLMLAFSGEVKAYLKQFTR